MIALTQEKREELIAKCNKQIEMATALKGIEISIDARNDLEDMILMSEATLASLNSNPEMYVNCIERCDSYGPEIERRAYPDLLSAMKSKEDHGGVVLELFTAPPVPDIKLSLLQSRDLESLIRFNETCEDGEGYDLSKDKMDRLVELGVVRKIKGGIREITALGQMYIDINRKDSPSEFLMTETDRAAAFNQHLKRLNGSGE